MGGVLTRRVKGEFGAIEIVLAVKNDGRLAGVKLQRIREPESVAKAFSEAWLRSFRGKSSESNWRLGQDVPAVSDAAKVSALAILEGVRSQLILLAVALSTR